MAKYVEHCPDVYPQQERGVNIWWLPEEFSQSRLGDRVIGSNACSLIAVLLAGRVDEFHLDIWGLIDQPLTRLLVTSIAEAIVEGNELHEGLVKSKMLPSLNLTVVEALHAVNHKYPFLVEWVDQTVLIMEPMGETLAASLEKPINAWASAPPLNRKTNSDLFGILVGADKTVVFIYQPQLGKVTLIDGHSHVQCQAGGVIAQTRVGDLNQLCSWFVQMWERAFNKGWNVKPYELTFLYSQDPYY